MSNINEYKEHIVAFIDLLGFKNAVTIKRQQEILELLQLFSKLTNDFFAEINQTANSTSYKILPTISVFSDNVVISVPIRDDIPNFILLKSLAESITWFAARALEKKFLIRGGIAKGSLYHKENIVFGTALIDAYKLECDLANYPRILVSRELYDFIESKTFFTEDFDGMIMLNYIDGLGAGLIRAGLRQDEALCSNISKRISLFEKIISENIDKLSLDNKQKELSKWTWFSKYYQKIRNREYDILDLIAQKNPDMKF